MQVLNLFSHQGLVARRRRATRVQASDGTHRQVHHTALQPFQSRLGLAHPPVGHLHGHPYPVLRRLPSQRSRGAEETRMWLLVQPAQRRGLNSGHHVHHRHPHKLSHHVRQLERGGREPSGEDRHPLLQRLVPYRHGGGHSLRPAYIRLRV